MTMRFAEPPVVEWITNPSDERQSRITQQEQRIARAYIKIAELERDGQTELVRSSRKFLARMESVLIEITKFAAE